MKRLFRKKIIIILVIACFSSGVFSFAYTRLKKDKFPFYVYSSYGDAERFHFYASGRMGDALCIKMTGNCREKPLSGKSCIKIGYDVSDSSRTHLNWAGMYWLDPANNWGKIPDAGYDLRGARRMVFHARGEKGGERIAFKVGGIYDHYGDTTEAFIPLVTLTKEWQQYVIPLGENNNLARIVGGFCWSANRQENPEGAIFYLDEIYYE